MAQSPLELVTKQMSIRNQGICCIVWVALCFAATSATSTITMAAERDIVSTDDAVRQLIEMISSDVVPQRRQKYAKSILSYSMELPEDIDDKTILLIGELLSDRDDLVRFYSAASLGYFRERAKFVVPLLLKALDEKECTTQGLSSVGAVRKALQRIGEPAPIRRCY